MPVDVNGWRAGIANSRYSLTLRLTRPINDTFLSCTLSIIWLFLYVYHFIALSLVTVPLSLWVTAVFTYMPFLSRLLSCLFASNGSLILDDLIINFASLTLYAQATVYFLKPFIKFVYLLATECFSDVLRVSKQLMVSKKQYIIGLSRFLLFSYILLSSVCDLILAENYISLKLILAGDIHPHPGPVNKSLKFCHWNLNSILTRNKIKISLIEAYNSVFHYDLFAISESLLNDSIKDDEIHIEGFSKEIFRSDHPSGKKVGGVCLYFKENLPIKRRKKIVSARRGIGVIRYMSRYVTRDVLDQMYKLYIRPHLDYGDIIYHKYDPEMNLDFTKKLEATQYTAALAVSGAWRGTNKYKLYEELGWESLYHRRWYRRLTHFFKLKNRCSPLYLYDLIPPEREIHYDLRAPRDYVPQIERTVRFSNTYFQNCIHEWNLLDVSTRSIQSISQFKTELLGRIRPPKRPTFNIYDIEGIKLLARLRVEFSDLRNHRYRHNFHCPNPTCLCQTGIENNEHFLLHCPRFSSRRRVLLDLVSKSVNFDILRLSSKELCNLLLYGHSKCTIITNRVIIESTLEYIKSTGRFKKK